MPPLLPEPIQSSENTTPNLCRVCHGRGEQACGVCTGRGVVELTDEYIETCPLCLGRGVVTCSKCIGLGLADVRGILRDGKVHNLRLYTGLVAAVQ